VGFFVLDTAAAGANLVVRTEEGETMNYETTARTIEAALQDQVKGKQIEMFDYTMANDWSRAVVKNMRTGINVAHVNVAELASSPCFDDSIIRLAKQIEGAQH
jgi:hypothetical protein